MKVCFDGDKQSPEVEISGTALELKRLGESLVHEISELFVESQGEADEYYPILLGGLRCKRNESIPNPNLVEVGLKHSIFVIIGGREGLRKLGQSCINVFSDAEDGEHMHLEYFEEQQLLAKTDYSLIFSCSEK